jgi:hypothetical protein
MTKTQKKAIKSVRQQVLDKLKDCGGPHKWYVSSHTVPGRKKYKKHEKRPEIIFNCRKCQVRIIRQMTDKEIVKYHKRWHDTRKDIERRQHRWHDFVQKVLNKKHNKGEVLSGYKLQEVAEKYAKRYPKEVFIATCDDSYFTGSRIIIIPVKKMGANMVYIPQNDQCGKPVDLFLYPYHLDSLLKGLQKAKKMVGKDRWD